MLGTVEANLLQFTCKPPLVKPTYKWKIKTPKTQEGTMASESSSMLSEGTIEVGQVNKEFFTHPFIIPKKKKKTA